MLLISCGCIRLRLRNLAESGAVAGGQREGWVSSCRMTRTIRGAVPCEGGIER